jgi:hypothetical protein
MDGANDRIQGPPGRCNLPGEGDHQHVQINQDLISQNGRSGQHQERTVGTVNEELDKWRLGSRLFRDRDPAIPPILSICEQFDDAAQPLNNITSDGDSQRTDQDSGTGGTLVLGLGLRPDSAGWNLEAAHESGILPIPDQLYNEGSGRDSHWEYLQAQMMEVETMGDAANRIQRDPANQMANQR